MSSSFAYVPLKEPDEIRLLTLEPASNPNEPLQGSLQHTTLSLKDYDILETYVALSYVWGDPTPADTIVLDGCEVGITFNLSKALRSIRDGTRKHLLWVDALCIDQARIPERNRQVSLMGEIYRTARRTIIYLGELSPDVEFVLRKVPRSEPRDYDDRHSTPGCPTHSTVEDCKRGRCKDLEDILLVNNAAIRDLLARPWFTRVWVLQELALSRDPRVQCGKLRVRWQDLSAFLLPVLERVSKIEGSLIENTGTTAAYNPSKGVHVLRYMNEVREAVHLSSRVEGFKYTQQLEALTLWRMLGGRLGSQSTDPRDMIYAHMGLHSDRPRVKRLIKIDYSKSIREVFAAAGHYFWRYADQSQLSGMFTRSQLRSSLPSWAPDWGVHSSLKPLDDERTGENNIPSPETLLISSSHELRTVRWVSDPLLPPEKLSIVLSGWSFGDMSFDQKPRHNLGSCGRKEWDGLMRALYGKRHEPTSLVQSHPIYWAETILQETGSDGGFDSAFAYLASYVSGDMRKFSLEKRARLALLSNDEVMLVDENVQAGDRIFNIGFVEGDYDRVSRPQLIVRRLEPQVTYDKLDAKIIERVRSSPSREAPIPEDLAIEHCRLIARSEKKLSKWRCKRSHGTGTEDRESWLAIH